MKQIDLDKAIQHYKKYDPLLYDIAKTVNIVLPQKKKQSDYFKELCESIVSQQLSVKAARTIWLRFNELVIEVSPQNILNESEQNLRTAGLSRQKISYLLALSETTTSGELQITNLNYLSDEEVIEQLCRVKGVGKWTAEMFLLFTLGRKDVFSLGDLGLRTAADRLYGPGLLKEDLERISAVWAPHRSIASLILWSTLDNQPKD